MPVTKLAFTPTLASAGPPLYQAATQSVGDRALREFSGENLKKMFSWAHSGNRVRSVYDVTRSPKPISAKIVREGEPSPPLDDVSQFLSDNKYPLIGGGALAALGVGSYLMNRSSHKDDEEDEKKIVKQADWLNEQKHQLASQFWEWADENRDSAQNLMGAVGSAGYAPLTVLLGGLIGGAKAPAHASLKGICRGAVQGVGGAAGGIIGRGIQAGIGAPDSLGQQIGSGIGGALLGRYLAAKYTGPLDQSDVRKEKPMPTKTAHVLSAWRPGNLSGLVKKAVDPVPAVPGAPAAPNMIERLWNENGQPLVDKAVQTSTTNAVKGIGDQVGNYIDAHPWAKGLAYGAPIGAGLGLVTGLATRKKDKWKAFHDALSGGLMGGMAGAAGGGAWELAGGLKDDTKSPMVPPTPEETSKDKVKTTLARFGLDETGNKPPAPPPPPAAVPGAVPGGVKTPSPGKTPLEKGMKQIGATVGHGLDWLVDAASPPAAEGAPDPVVDNAMGGYVTAGAKALANRGANGVLAPDDPIAASLNNFRDASNDAAKLRSLPGLGQFAPQSLDPLAPEHTAQTLQAAQQTAAEQLRSATEAALRPSMQAVIGGAFNTDGRPMLPGAEAQLAAATGGTGQVNVTTPPDNRFSPAARGGLEMGALGAGVPLARSGYARLTAPSAATEIKTMAESVLGDTTRAAALAASKNPAFVSAAASFAKMTPKDVIADLESPAGPRPALGAALREMQHKGGKLDLPAGTPVPGASFPKSPIAGIADDRYEQIRTGTGPRASRGERQLLEATHAGHQFTFPGRRFDVGNSGGGMRVVGSDEPFRLIRDVAPAPTPPFQIETALDNLRTPPPVRGSANLPPGAVAKMQRPVRPVLPGPAGIPTVQPNDPLPAPIRAAIDRAKGLLEPAASPASLADSLSQRIRAVMPPTTKPLDATPSGLPYSVITPADSLKARFATETWPSISGSGIGRPPEMTPRHVGSLHAETPPLPHGRVRGALAKPFKSAPVGGLLGLALGSLTSAASGYGRSTGEQVAAQLQNGPVPAGSLDWSRVLNQHNPVIKGVVDGTNLSAPNLASAKRLLDNNALESATGEAVKERLRQAGMLPPRTP